MNADGWLISSRAAGGKGLGQGALTDHGATIESACIETNPSVAPDGVDGFGPNLTPLAFHRSPFQPDSDDDLPLRAYALWDEEATQCRGPRHVGLGRLGAAHVLGLGDGALRQLDRLSTRQLPRTLAGGLDQVHDLVSDLPRAVHEALAHAQVVTAGATGRQTHIEVAVARAAPASEPIVLEIQGVTVGLPSGIALASVSIPAGDVSTALDFVTVDITAFEVRFFAGDTFAIVLRSEAQDGAGYLWGGVERGWYGPGTSAFRSGTGAWEPDAATPDADRAFRTFVDAGHPPSATPSACNDHLDNDEDGLADLLDPGCALWRSPREDPGCDDGVDNDGDGGTDFDGAGVGPPDLQCTSGHLMNEAVSTQACGMGVELVLLLPLLLRLRRPARSPSGRRSCPRRSVASAAR